MTTPLEVNDAQIADWRATNYPYKVIAADIAAWARGQERGTVLPGNDFFAGDLAIVASASTWNRAKTFLAAVGVLYSDDGPYQVSLFPPGPVSPAGPDGRLIRLPSWPAPPT
jgi:hypothetical protein